MIRSRLAPAGAAVLLVLAGVSPWARADRRPLRPADVDGIVTLVRIEDTRNFDAAILTRLLQADHPDVRRRAAITIGRLADPRGRALLAAARSDRDPAVAAAVVFATGQLKDAEAVSWLTSLLVAPTTIPDIAREAACALGKIRSPESRVALVQYLSQAATSSPTAAVVGEALLSLGRFTGATDLASIDRWTTARDVEVRWRAAWALYRPRDPAALPDLLRLSHDPSADVRFWAMRGLGVPPPPAAGRRGAPAPPALASAAPSTPIASTPIDRVALSARLREGVRDSDRRVRTEALRALGTYDDDASFAIVLASLESPDSWLSVSAAEALARFTTRADVVVPRLVAAAATTRPLSLRLTALSSLTALSADAAIDVAAALVHVESLTARTAAVQALQRLGAPGRARLEALSSDPAVRALVPPPGARQPRVQVPAFTDADYRGVVERWVVPDYNGAKRPRVIWQTPRGTIELELYAGDAPLGVEYLMRVVTSGAIVGSEFGRVVPNFVAQERAIQDDVTLRDEVNQHGLTRANLSWASAGLDTGRPGYTLGNTPQPHNEGDFTALGRVVRGMDVVDRLELGDAITAARVER